MPLRLLSSVVLPILIAFFLLRGVSMIGSYGSISVVRETLPITGPKFECFAAHKDEVTGLLLGSSEMDADLDPRVIDSELGTAGAPTRSFNFGFPHATLSEEYLMLEGILALKPPRLRWILLDASVPAATTDATSFQYSLRDLWAHPWSEVRLHVNAILDSRALLPEKVASLIAEAHKFFDRSVSPGRQAEWLQMKVFDRLYRRRESRELEASRLCEKMGYTEQFDLNRYLPKTDPALFGTQESFLASLRGKTSFPRPSRFRTEMVRRIQELARSAGIQVVFIILPTHSVSWDLPEGSAVLSVGGPEMKPVREEFEHRNRDHLSLEGARIYSREVGRSLAEFMLRSRR